MIRIFAKHRILSLIVTVAVLFGSIPISTAAQDSFDTVDCTHEHDTACGYIEAADCTHICGEDCVGGCIHEHGGDCGYIEAAPCTHEHDADCGGLEQDGDLVLGESGDVGDTGATGSPDTPTADNVQLGYSVVTFAALADEVVNQSVTVGAGLEDVTLPESLEATVSDGETEDETTIEGVIWQSEPEFAAITIGALEIVPVGTYVFTPALPEGYALSDGVDLPVITVEVKPPEIAAATKSVTWNGGTQNAQTLTDCEVTVIGTVTVKGTLTCAGTVTFTGGGTLLRDPSFVASSFWGEYAKTLITVGANADVTITGVTVDGNKNNVINSFVPGDCGSPLVKVQSGGKLTINDGTYLQNNSFIQSNYGSGSCLHIENGGIFNMNGGTIRGNIANSANAGVAVYGGTFNMSGGEISGNTAGNSGGGVGVSNNGIINMSGGVITGNTGPYGGGVNISSNGTLNMSGGEITGNFGTNGGGVNVGGTFTAGGTAQITGNTNTSGNAPNNVYFYTNCFLTLGTDDNGVSTPDESMLIGVSISNSPPGATIVQAGANSDHLRYLTSDTATKALFCDSGAIILATKIASVNNITVTAPVVGNTPSYTASGTTTYTTRGSVTWAPELSPTGKFLGGTQYTASVTLTANDGYTFTGLTSATINNQSATVTNNNKTITLSYQFPATAAATVSGITVKNQPTKLIYTRGENLDLSGLVVELAHNDGTTKDVAFADFSSNNITTSPANDTALNVSNSGSPVTVIYNNSPTIRHSTSSLTVTKAIPTVSVWPSATAITYGQTLNNSTLSGGTASVAGSFTWEIPSSKPNAGMSSHNVTFTPSDTANYEKVTGSVNVTVKKAGGIFGSPPAINTTYSPGLTLSGLSGQLQTDYVWVNSNTVINAGNGQTFPATYTDSSGNYDPASGMITVNVAKAAISGAPTITIGGGTLKIGATLTADTTHLNANGDAGTTLTYQWKSGGAAVGTNSDTYTVTSLDVGKSITVTVTADGNYEGTKQSLPTAAVPYTIKLVKSGAASGDNVYFSVQEPTVTYAASGNVTIYYTLANPHIENTLELSSNGTNIDIITTPGTGTVDYTVNASHANSSGEIIITADFSHTSVLTIANVTIAAPVNGESPQNTITTGSSYYTAAILWDGNPTVFMSDTTYTATITLTAQNGVAFDSDFIPSVSGGTISGLSVSSGSVSFVVTFPQTFTKKVSKITVKTQPDLVYVAGDKLDLSNLIVEVTYDDTSTEDITYDKSGIAYKLNGTAVTSGTAVMTKAADSKTVAITYDGKSTNTYNLTVYTTPTLHISVTDITSTTAKISYNATGDSRNSITSELQVRIGGAWSDVAGAYSPYTASVLAPAKTYEYRIWAKDNTTNREYAKSVTFKTAVSAPSGIDVGGEIIDTSSPAAIWVTLEHGNTVISSVQAAAKGGSTHTYTFSFNDVPNGVYNLVVDNGSWKVTQAITVVNNIITNPVGGILIDMSVGRTQSVVEIVNDDTPPAAVDGLTNLFTDSKIYTAEDKVIVTGGGTVEIKLAVEQKDNPQDANVIAGAALGQTVGLYLDLSVIKSQFDGAGTLLDESKLSDLNGKFITITFVLPDDLKGKSGLTIYRVHNNIAEALTSVPNTSGETAVISGDIVRLRVCNFSTFAIAYTPSNPPANPTNPQSNGDSSSDSASSGSSGSGTNKTVMSTYWIEEPEAKTMAKTAKEKEMDYVRSRRNTITGIRKNALLALTGLRYQHDTVEGNTVQVRIYVDDPAKTAKDILVSGYVKGNEVDKVKKRFEKWFANKIVVISFDQQGDFGIQVQIAANVNLNGLDTNNLNFYGYNKQTNKYTQIKTDYRIDGNGYLHFSTVLAGDIIVSNGPLANKAEVQTSVDGDKYYYLLTTPTLESRNANVSDSILHKQSTDTPLILEEVDIKNVSGVLLVDLDTTLTQDGVTKSLNRYSISGFVVLGITLALLLSSLVLWVIIPRKDDLLVSVEEYRKKR